MEIVKSSLSALGVASAMAVLAGCGNGGTGLPAAHAPPAALARVDHGASWMAPDAKRHALLYVADLGTDDVDVYSYPRGRLKGVLTGFGSLQFECVDAAGNVFISDGGHNQLVEYAHGGTQPIKTYSEPAFVHGCSVDPTTGDLAVLHDPPTASGPGDVSIYRQARGKPHEYSTGNVFRVYFIGYDGHGNLFVDGTDMHVGFEMAELPKGGDQFQAITLNQHIVLPAGIQWDGEYLAVGDQVSLYGPSKIYEFSISGSTGALVGTTPLSDSCDMLQFWIQGRRVVTSDVCAPHVLYFDYPSGGSSTKTISRDLSEPVGVTVSVK